MAAHSNILAWRIPKDRGVWWATVHRVAKNQTRLQQPSTHSTETFLFVTTWGGGGTIGISWVETRDAVKHPKVLRTASPCPPQRKIYLYTETPIYKNTQRIQIIKGEMVIDATVEKIT